MILGSVKETAAEPRVALLPSAVEKLRKNGAQVCLEPGYADRLKIADDVYVQAGAEMTDRNAILSRSQTLVQIRQPLPEEIDHMTAGCIHISFLDPFHNQPLIETLAKKNISAISMEMIPRTTLAQKMDALSSQANLAGYAAVIVAEERSTKIFPMMMTPAGTIAPSRVLVIGAGVAGLQAIATAKRLGARVEAFDTRPVVKEQVRSLGAKFVKIDLGETGQTQEGYAKALTDDQLQRQREGLARVISQSDVVITTAQVFGKKAPRIVTRDMVAGMKPGSIIVDLAIESGGNVEGIVFGEETEVNGVLLFGMPNLPGRVAHHASQMYANNIVSLIESYWDKEAKIFSLDLTDEIIQGCLLTHNGQIVNEKLKTFVKG